MGATAADRQQLDVLDTLALLTCADGDLRAVITRLANAAQTRDDAAPLVLAISLRGDLRRLRNLVAARHRDSRGTPYDRG